ncbi:MAG: hypothetical protein HWE20_05580 [Gammaproteobacteria bacterium]|nr:hypothetical protein [Gammaproteobacteria bacterium]
MVRLRADQLELTDREVIERWLSVYTGDEKLRQYLNGELHAEAASELENSVIPALRGRLHSLSWFMSCQNQQIAVTANKEDDVTGHFYSGFAST